MGQAEPSATSGGTQALCHYLYSSSLNMGSAPHLWQSLSCFLRLNIFSCLQRFCSAVMCFVRKGQVGGWDSALFSCSPRCNCCSPALCVLPEHSPATLSALPVAGNPVGQHLCQSCVGDEASAARKAQYFPFKTDRTQHAPWACNYWLRSMWFFCSLHFSLLLILQFFSFLGWQRASSYCGLSLSCLALHPQPKVLCDAEGPTDVAGGTSIASLSTPSGDLQTHFGEFSLSLSSWLYLKALLSAL